MGLFALLEEDSQASQVPIPNLPELSPAERMLMEKETTGIYISGHPMDDYRELLKKTHVVPMGTLLEEGSGFRDEQTVTVAGVVQSVKVKTTRNNTLMAYVTVEDDTGAMEMLAFSSALDQYGGYLKENEVVTVTGKLSLRDEKDPQILINRVRPIAQLEPEPLRLPEPDRRPPVIYTGKLYLRLPTETGSLFPRIRAVLNMFPGESTAVVYFSDNGTRRGTCCTLDRRMLEELKNILGEANVVLK